MFIEPLRCIDRGCVDGRGTAGTKGRRHRSSPPAQPWVLCPQPVGLARQPPGCWVSRLAQGATRASSFRHALRASYASLVRGTDLRPRATRAWPGGASDAYLAALGCHSSEALSQSFGRLLCLGELPVGHPLDLTHFHERALGRLAGDGGGDGMSQHPEGRDAVGEEQVLPRNG